VGFFTNYPEAAIYPPNAHQISKAGNGSYIIHMDAVLGRRGSIQNKRNYRKSSIFGHITHFSDSIDWVIQAGPACLSQTKKRPYKSSRLSTTPWRTSTKIIVFQLTYGCCIIPRFVNLLSVHIFGCPGRVSCVVAPFRLSQRLLSCEFILVHPAADSISRFGLTSPSP
jgi:hypothetical protein